MKNEIANIEISNKIYPIRGQQVMLDRDLAVLYCVETKVLNQTVKRNIERFPEDFMFQLTEDELKKWKSQIVTSNSEIMGLRKKPYAFTEQGVATLSGILKSSQAITVNIKIMRAFVAMRKFLVDNAQMFFRLDLVERKQIGYEVKQLEHDRKFEEVFNAIEDKGIKPEKGIFFEGQVFDAYSFVSDLVMSAKSSIILIDNYVDHSVLTLLSKRAKGVRAVIYTRTISKQLSLDLEKHSSQYPPIDAREFDGSHDRFLVIDGKEVYHLGASLKDLGKKWFAFSKFEKEAMALIDRLGTLKP